MIQANELRIGNNILLLGEVCTIECISNLPKRKEMYWIKTKEFIDTKIIHFKPIPLTEEILLKCETRFNGIRHRAEIWIQGECFEFIVDKDKFHLEFTGGEGVSYSKPIYFLHQLQNLYFALTNEELTFNNL